MKYKQLPKDFDVAVYRACNSEELKECSNLECEVHYIIYGNEKSCYKSQHVLPPDFDPERYKRYNPDLNNLTDEQLKAHYYQHGLKENRVYKIELPPDFDVEVYKLRNKDISDCPNGWLERHYFQYGKAENREYKDKFFNKDFFIKHNKVKNYKGYTDYLKDIRQIKSKEIFNKIKNIRERKNCILLVSHENSFYGATNYLYLVYSILKKHNKKVVIVETEPNTQLLKKYSVKAEDVMYYYKDATLLYWICKKTNPKIIHFNSINNEISAVLKHLNKNKYFTHSHEIKEHYGVHGLPDFVVSKRISEQYNYAPKIQTPILSEEHLKEIDCFFKTKNIEVSNKHGVLDTKKITIGMCGSLTVRKNYHLFLEVAEKLKEFNFLWIGGDNDLLTDLTNVYHVKSTPHPYSYYTLIDYFVLFSSVDPCPYVVLENIYVGNKVLTFKNNIYTQHDSQVLEGEYFEFDGPITPDNAILHIKNTAVCKPTRN